MGRVVRVIWGDREQEYFCGRDWTGQITLKSLQKINLPRTSAICPTGRTRGRTAGCCTSSAAADGSRECAREQRASYTPERLNDKLMKMFAGSKTWADGPAAINVLTFVRHLDRKLPGFLAAYESLSEYAHPNWRGVSGLYSKIEREDFTAYFGRGFRADLAGGQLVHALVGGLMAFEDAYNKVADVMPVWVAELEKIWPDEDEGPARS
jgi:hypothetical protein